MIDHWDATQFVGHPALGPRSPRVYQSGLFSASPLNHLANAVRERPPARAPSVTFNVEAVHILESESKRQHLIEMVNVARTMYAVPLVFLAPGPALFHLHRWPELLPAFDAIACAQYFGEGSTIAVQKRQCHQAATYCALIGRPAQAVTTHRHIGKGERAGIPVELYRQILQVTAEFFMTVQWWSNDQNEPEPTEHVPVWRQVIQGIA